jgi:hypothetical protein
MIELLIYQYATYGLLILFLLFLMFMPASARVRFKARMSRSGILVTLFSDDGFEKTELMKAELGQGILTGNPTTYLFQPRPTKLKGKGKNKKEYVDANPDQKEFIDEAMKHMCISDTNKPLLLGYIGKSLVVTPKLLALIKKVHRRAKEGKIKELELIDPRILKSYMSRTISKSAIESIKFEHERIGFNRKPVSDALKKWAFPAGAIVVIIIALYAWQSGMIDLSFLNFGG